MSRVVDFVIARPGPGAGGASTLHHPPSWREAATGTWKVHNAKWIEAPELKVLTCSAQHTWDSKNNRWLEKQDHLWFFA